MSNTHRRPLGQVSNWHPATNEVTPAYRMSTFVPHGLTLKHKVGQATITNVVDAGATVVYTADNNYSAGNIVSIYDVNPDAYNLKNATILSATSTSFTITTAATGTYVSGGTAQRTGTQSVTIPAGITWVYAICVGAGGSGGVHGSSSGGGGGAGGISWGWTLANSTCVVGVGVHGVGGYTRYGHIIAGGGGQGPNAGSGGAGPSVVGGAGAGAGGTNVSAGQSGITNYYGISAGTAVSNAIGNIGAAAAGGGKGDVTSTLSSAGGNGISGGGGGAIYNNIGSTSIAGNGGNGLAGGGGGGGTSTIITSGNGGNGINILTGAVTTGGAGVSRAGFSGGGGGAGVAGNGNPGSVQAGGNGGLGGGGGGGGNTFASGLGGNGIVYIWY